MIKVTVLLDKPWGRLEKEMFSSCFCLRTHSEYRGLRGQALRGNTLPAPHREALLVLQKHYSQQAPPDPPNNKAQEPITGDHHNQDLHCLGSNPTSTQLLLTALTFEFFRESTDSLFLSESSVFPRVHSINGPTFVTI